jgi:hypothetical protein
MENDEHHQQGHQKTDSPSSSSPHHHHHAKLDELHPLRLSLTLKDPVLSSTLPQLSHSAFDFTNSEHLESLVEFFPLSERHFIQTFLFTQQFTVYTEQLMKTLDQDYKKTSIETLAEREGYLLTPTTTTTTTGETTTGGVKQVISSPSSLSLYL